MTAFPCVIATPSFVPAAILTQRTASTSAYDTAKPQIWFVPGTAMSLRPALLPALGVFAAAARHQNFAHAADELHLTASAVSHHVRKLEARMGVALFQRHQVRVARLTVSPTNGRALRYYARHGWRDLGPRAGASHVHDMALLVPPSGAPAPA